MVLAQMYAVCASNIAASYFLNFTRPKLADVPYWVMPSPKSQSNCELFKREITTSRSKITKKYCHHKKRSALRIDTDQTLDNYQREKYVSILHKHDYSHKLNICYRFHLKKFFNQKLIICYKCKFIIIVGDFNLYPAITTLIRI